jgi:hypothetical protein
MTKVLFLRLVFRKLRGRYDCRASQVRDISVQGFQDKQKKRIEEREARKIRCKHEIR